MTAPWEIHVFDQQDDRWYTDGGDWAFLHFKADCSSSAVVVGLSVNRKTGGGHAITCHDHLIPMLAPASVAIDFFTGSKQRDTLPEWDAGYFKGECAEDEAVTGVAQTTEGRLTTLRCTRLGGGFRRNVCVPHVVAGGDKKGSTTLDDWAKEADKGQCLTGQILKGVSKSARTGAVHAILCCYVSAM
jgi:hypothetical protein